MVTNSLKFPHRKTNRCIVMVRKQKELVVDIMAYDPTKFDNKYSFLRICKLNLPRYRVQVGPDSGALNFFLHLFGRLSEDRCGDVYDRKGIAEVRPRKLETERQDEFEHVKGSFRSRSKGIPLQHNRAERNTSESPRHDKDTTWKTR